MRSRCHSRIPVLLTLNRLAGTAAGAGMDMVGAGVTVMGMAGDTVVTEEGATASRSGTPTGAGRSDDAWDVGRQQVRRKRIRLRDLAYRRNAVGFRRALELGC